MSVKELSLVEINEVSGADFNWDSCYGPVTFGFLGGFGAAAASSWWTGPAIDFGVSTIWGLGGAFAGSYGCWF